MAMNRRPPLPQNGLPAPQGVPTAIDWNDQCAVLPMLRAAYYSLLAGNQTAKIRDGDREQHFAKGDAKFLQMEIRRLEILCGSDPTRRAIRAGGPRPFPYPGRGYWGGW